MNTELTETDKRIKECDDQISVLLQRKEWLIKLKEKLDKLPTSSMWGTSLDFDHLPHKDIVKVIRTIGGKWKKEPNTTAPGTIDYVTEVDGVRVRCFAGKPPPSCRMIEVEELVPEVPAIPARIVKRMKLVCVAAHRIDLNRPSAGGNRGTNPT